MRVLLFDGTAVKFRQFHPEPTPAPDEAIVRVDMAGVCHTDIQISRGYLGFKGVIGHEFVGTVTKCADRKWVGKRVVGEINCICGKCDMCQSGLSQHCRMRTVVGSQGRDGCFADYVQVPVRNLHLVQASLSIEEAVFVEPLAAALQIQLQCPLDSRSKVTILGDGPLGQLCAMAIQRQQCKLTLIGRHAAKLAVADRRGIRTALDQETTPKKDQDVVIDCTGRPGGFARALQFVRPRGTVVLKTTLAQESHVHLAAVVIDEITILGSRCGPFREALALLESKQLDTTGLISRRIKIEQAEEVFQSPMPSESLKVLVTFGR